MCPKIIAYPSAYPQDSATCVAASGHCIFAGSVDGSVRRFDVRLGRATCDQLHHPVTSLAVTRDGLCVIAACTDSTLRLLDVNSGQQLARYTGHVHVAVKMDCCLTPSDAYVVGSSETGENCSLCDNVRPVCAWCSLRCNEHGYR